MSIFYILAFVYITILMVFGLLAIFISSWELIISNILRNIPKITGICPRAGFGPNFHYSGLGYLSYDLREHFDYYNDRLYHRGIDRQIPAHLLYYQAVSLVF